MRKLVVKKSLFPEGNKTHILISKTETKRGICEGRIFKGTRQECLREKENYVLQKKIV